MDLFLIIFVSLIGLLETRIGLLSFWDESIMFIMLFAYFFQKHRKINQKEKRIITLLLILMVVIGLMGNNLHSEYQNSVIAIIKDIIAFLKFPILMLVTPDILNNHRNNKRKIIKFSKAYIVLLCIFAVVGYVIDIGVYGYDDSKIFPKFFEFYYSHCTFMVATVLSLTALLIADAKKRNIPYIFVGCFLLIMSQRTKACFLAFIIMLMMIINVNKLSPFLKKTSNYTKIRKFKCLSISILLVVCAWLVSKGRIDKFWKYGLSSARPALYMVGVKIAKDCFPIGSGFATFSSSLSGRYYSGVYETYKISDVLGLTKEDYSYMADTFFPYIYGQFGFIAFIAYSLLIIILIKKHINNAKNYHILAAFIILWIYMIFASSAETIFTNSTAIQFAIVFAAIGVWGKSKTPIYTDKFDGKVSNE